jgi:hypothetical protein
LEEYKPAVCRTAVDDLGAVSKSSSPTWLCLPLTDGCGFEVFDTDDASL